MQGQVHWVGLVMLWRVQDIKERRKIGIVSSFPISASMLAVTPTVETVMLCGDAEAFGGMWDHLVIVSRRIGKGSLVRPCL